VDTTEKADLECVGASALLRSMAASAASKCHSGALKVTTWISQASRSRTTASAQLALSARAPSSLSSSFLFFRIFFARGTASEAAFARGTARLFHARGGGTSKTQAERGRKESDGALRYGGQHEVVSFTEP
jgi:hypothetical protein